MGSFIFKINKTVDAEWCDISGRHFHLNRNITEHDLKVSNQNCMLTMALNEQ